MKLIAGLGNPGEKYTNTRHNIGFCIADNLAGKYNKKLKRKFLTNTEQANLPIAGESVTIIKPQTFMNVSGSSVLHFYKKLKLRLEDILVICDDVSLPIGKIRIRPGGQAGGHNGLGSVIDYLGSENFPRLRVGIENSRAGADLSKYVLSEFTSAEASAIAQAAKDALNACECWVTNGIEAAMNMYN